MELCSSEAQGLLCALGLLEGKRLGWPAFKGKELDDLKDTHTIKTLGELGCRKKFRVLSLFSRYVCAR